MMDAFSYPINFLVMIQLIELIFVLSMLLYIIWPLNDQEFGLMEFKTAIHGHRLKKPLFQSLDIIQYTGYTVVIVGLIAMYLGA